MNQRQWVPMEESTISKKRVMVRMNGIIVVVATMVFTLIGSLAGYPLQAAVVGLVAALLFVRTITRSAESSVLSAVVSEEASVTVHARIFNVVDGLCVVSGDQRPALKVVESAYPLALAVAQPEQAGTIIVSSGFCDVMERVEVEAVVAHLLWRIRTGEVALTTYLLSLIRWLSRLGLGAVGRAMSSRAMDERVLLWADIAACQATRYPPALISALEKTERAVPNVDVHVPTSLWFASPDADGDDATDAGGFSSLGVRHPSLMERIAVLKEI